MLIIIIYMAVTSITIIIITILTAVSSILQQGVLEPAHLIVNILGEFCEPIIKHA